MAGKYPAPNDTTYDLLKKLVSNTADISNAGTGIDAELTLSSLIGKTATFVKGLIKSFS